MKCLSLKFNYEELLLLSPISLPLPPISLSLLSTASPAHSLPLSPGQKVVTRLNLCLSAATSLTGIVCMHAYMYAPLTPLTVLHDSGSLTFCPNLATGDVNYWV